MFELADQWTLSSQRQKELAMQNKIKLATFAYWVKNTNNLIRQENVDGHEMRLTDEINDFPLLKT